MYLSKNICYEIIYQTELLWFTATYKVTEDSIKPDKIELEKDYDVATQNCQGDEEEYDPVPCELLESKMMFVYNPNKTQRLYRRCASTLVLLDVTYQTNKYSLLFYSLVAQTNVNY